MLIFPGWIKPKNVELHIHRVEHWFSMVLHDFYKGGRVRAWDGDDEDVKLAILRRLSISFMLIYEIGFLSLVNLWSIRITNYLNGDFWKPYLQDLLSGVWWCISYQMWFSFSNCLKYKNDRFIEMYSCLQLSQYVFDPHLGTLICQMKKATDFSPMVSV